jgi:hypothetical protein
LTTLGKRRSLREPPGGTGQVRKQKGFSEMEGVNWETQEKSCLEHGGGQVGVMEV